MANPTNAKCLLVFPAVTGPVSAATQVQTNPFHLPTPTLDQFGATPGMQMLLRITGKSIGVQSGATVGAYPQSKLQVAQVNPFTSDNGSELVIDPVSGDFIVPPNLQNSVVTLYGTVYALADAGSINAGCFVIPVEAQFYAVETGD